VSLDVRAQEKLMQRFTLPHVLVVALAISMSAFADEYSDLERTFSIGDQTVMLDDQMLDQLRGMWRWDANGELVRKSVAIKPSDFRWALDYIALLQMLNYEECGELKLVEVREFDVKNDDEIGAFTGKIGLFDYAWIIDSCGALHIYRVYNEQDTADLSVIPAILSGLD